KFAMNFGNFLEQAKGAYDQYQQHNNSNAGNDEHRQESGYGYQQGNGPEPSHYQGQAPQQQHQQEYGDSGRQHESGGFDTSMIASMASKFLSGNENKSSEHSSSSGGGGLDLGKIATMASGFLGSQHGNNGGSSGGSSGGQSDMISSVLKMAMGSGGFSKGHDASHDDIKSSYQSVLGSGSGGLASQGQNAMGLAAAYMAFQQFQQEGGHSSGGGQNKLPGMAIAQAKKLFDQHSSQGGQANEKETLATAAQAAMKLFNSK
ncbi:hypothetical protein H4R20_004815, partial [Coemansia guatemalensis]